MFQAPRGQVIDDSIQPPPYNQASAPPITSALVPAYSYAQAQAGGLETVPIVKKAHEAMTSASYAAAMGASVPIDYFSGLEDIFLGKEIPLGLMDKLIALQAYTFHFKIDDSSSMRDLSTLNRNDACPYMKAIINEGQQKLTRWQEVEDRLHILIDLLSYVPTGPIILSHLIDPVL